MDNMHKQEVEESVEVSTQGVHRCTLSCAEFKSIACKRSDPFEIAKQKFCLVLYPRGPQTMASYLSINLEVDGDLKESIFAAFGVTIIKRKAVTKEHKSTKAGSSRRRFKASSSVSRGQSDGFRKCIHGRFSHSSRTLGWPDFIDKSILYDTCKGYIVDNTLELEVDLLVLSETLLIGRKEILDYGLSIDMEDEVVIWLIEIFLSFLDFLKKNRITSHCFLCNEHKFYLGVCIEKGSIGLSINSVDLFIGKHKFHLGLMPLEGGLMVGKDCFLSLKNTYETCYVMKVSALMDTHAGFVVDDTVLVLCRMSECVVQLHVENGSDQLQVEKVQLYVQDPSECEHDNECEDRLQSPNSKAQLLERDQSAEVVERVENECKHDNECEDLLQSSYSEAQLLERDQSGEVVERVEKLNKDLPQQYEVAEHIQLELQKLKKEISVHLAIAERNQLKLEKLTDRICILESAKSQRSDQVEKLKLENSCLRNNLEQSTESITKLKLENGRLQVRLHNNWEQSTKQISELKDMLSEQKSQHSNEVTKLNKKIARLHVRLHNKWEQYAEETRVLKNENDKLKSMMQSQDSQHFNMLEIDACMEMKAKSSSLVENTDGEFSDISFEELLAQEKKDPFWQQRNGKLREDF